MLSDKKLWQQIIGLLSIIIITGSLNCAALESLNEQQASHLFKLSQWMIWLDSVFETPTSPIRMYFR
jgi:hypothetical protein